MSGPLSRSSIHSNSVPLMARRAREFFTTRTYTPSLRAFSRNWVSFETESPRYSAATAESAPDATSATSLTTACFSA